ncbi:MAG: nucleotidyltransferase domain-containing protein [Burkholderiales bacterium]
MICPFKEIQWPNQTFGVNMNNAILNSPAETSTKSAIQRTGRKTLFPVDALLVEVFTRFPQIILVVLFGSVAQDRQRPDSDLDIAVGAAKPLTTDEKIAIIGALAEKTGRAIDLIDLNVVSEPLLGQVIRHGRRILGSDAHYGALIYRHLLEQADFMPYRARVLAERRKAWIGK